MQSIHAASATIAIDKVANIGLPIPSEITDSRARLAAWRDALKQPEGTPVLDALTAPPAQLTATLISAVNSPAVKKWRQATELEAEHNITAKLEAQILRSYQEAAPQIFDAIRDYYNTAGAEAHKALAELPEAIDLMQVAGNPEQSTAWARFVAAAAKLGQAGQIRNALAKLGYVANVDNIDLEKQTRKAVVTRRNQVNDYRRYAGWLEANPEIRKYADYLAIERSGAQIKMPTLAEQEALAASL